MTKPSHHGPCPPGRRSRAWALLRRPTRGAERPNLRGLLCPVHLGQKCNPHREAEHPQLCNPCGPESWLALAQQGLCLVLQSGLQLPFCSLWHARCQAAQGELTSTKMEAPASPGPREERLPRAAGAARRRQWQPLLGPEQRLGHLRDGPSQVPRCPTPSPLGCAPWPARWRDASAAPAPSAPRARRRCAAAAGRPARRRLPPAGGPDHGRGRPHRSVARLPTRGRHGPDARRMRLRRRSRSGRVRAQWHDAQCPQGGWTRDPPTHRRSKRRWPSAAEALLQQLPRQQRRRQRPGCCWGRGRSSPSDLGRSMRKGLRSWQPLGGGRMACEGAPRKPVHLADHHGCWCRCPRHGDRHWLGPGSEGRSSAPWRTELAAQPASAGTRQPRHQWRANSCGPCLRQPRSHWGAPHRSRRYRQGRAYPVCDAVRHAPSPKHGASQHRSRMTSRCLGRVTLPPTSPPRPKRTSSPCRAGRPEPLPPLQQLRRRLLPPQQPQQTGAGQQRLQAAARPAARPAGGRLSGSGPPRHSQWVPAGRW